MYVQVVAMGSGRFGQEQWPAARLAGEHGVLTPAEIATLAT